MRIPFGLLPSYARVAIYATLWPYLPRLMPRPLRSVGLGDPTNNDSVNLAALCQRCHILHDRKEHLRRRRLTYLARRAVGDLFSGPYRL